jgi:putative polyketide hydroxylase
VEQAFARYVARTAPWLQPTHETDALVSDFDIELGYLYGVPGRVHADPRTTLGLPGSRAPHLWLLRNGGRVSTIDLTGHYALLAGRDGQQWVEAARTVPDRFEGLALDAWRVGKDVTDPEDRFPQAFGITPAGATLIRPDGFVAWRSEGAAPDAGAALDAALRESLKL